MALWLWTFWTYSFLGYLLEGAYDAVTGQGPVRKGALLLPICPVYGLGALAVLSLPPALTGGFWSRALWGGLAATAAEYGVHLLYDRLLGVRFWDYARFPGNLRGRVCLPFSLAWGLLAAAVLPPLQAPLGLLAAAVPPAVTYGALLAFTAHTAVSLRLLARAGGPAALSLAALRRRWALFYGSARRRSLRPRARRYRHRCSPQALQERAPLPDSRNRSG